MFRRSHGWELSPRLEIPLKLAMVDNGDTILDVGCGRGEVVLHSALRGAKAIGIDYSKVAMEIAKETITSHRYKAFILLADCSMLPFRATAFDIVFFLDVIEHLYPEQVEVTMREIRRVLKPNSVVIITTGPNYYWDIIHEFWKLLCKKKVRTPRHRHLHVNLQTIKSLSKTLKKNDFTFTIFLQRFESGAFTGFLHAILEKLLNTRFLLRLFTPGFLIRVRKESL